MSIEVEQPKTEEETRAAEEFEGPEATAEENEFMNQLAELADAGDESGIYNFLQENRGKITSVQGPDVPGMNYNIDPYFVNLPNGKVVYYEIGGTHTSVVETSEVLSAAEAEQKSKILGMSSELMYMASDAVNDGDKRGKERMLKDLNNLLYEVGLTKDWVKKSLEGEKDK